ncbi:unnamed protein product [Auanema sp. JU1783]|nr:unnamed protein product [Auanema sp. JU1783]
MSILAGPKYKQRISVDPRNLTWKNEEDSVSKKLMRKMGWNSGDGLGKNRQGSSEHLKPKANYSGKGLGADKVASYDSTWIGHHDDFADLLSALNKNKESISKNTEASEDKDLEKMSMELKSKSIRRRIHYQKFTRAKDSSNYSANDKSAILGLGLKRTKEDEVVVKREIEEEFTTDTQHTVSTISMTDYFATKMAALKKKSKKVKDEPVDDYSEYEAERSQSTMVKEEPEDEGSEYDAEKSQSTMVKEEPEDEESDSESKKKKKSKKRERERERRTREESVEEAELDSESKKSKRRKAREEPVEEAESDSESKKKTKSKKKKKSKEEPEDEDL